MSLFESSLFEGSLDKVFNDYLPFLRKILQSSSLMKSTLVCNTTYLQICKRWNGGNEKNPTNNDFIQGNIL